MTDEERLREGIRKYISKAFELDEMSTTGNVAGYLTPNAFAGDGSSNKDRVRKMAKSIGYTLTKHGKRDAGNVDNLTENYHEYKNNPEKKPHQKIGLAIAEVNKQLKLIDKALRMNSRLQKEYGVTNDQLWKRTLNQMLRLEAKLVGLAARLREMRG